MTSNQPEYLPSIGRLLGFASMACNRLSDRRLKKHDLTLQQWIPLTALWRRDSMSESELAEYCRMSPSSMNRLMDRMEAKKLVRRKEDPNDQRRVLVTLGTRGKKLEHLQSFFSEINDVLVANMSKRETSEIIRLLECVVANLENELNE